MVSRATPPGYIAGLGGNVSQAITRGVVQYRNLVYYLSTIGVILLLTVQVLESRKWQ